jgi:predicted O-methyltransferase YrrM
LNFFSLFKRSILYKIKNKINIDLDDVNKDTLDELFHYYGSDKANIFKKTQNQGHGFSEFYTQHLKHLKQRKIKILEIGSYAGASASAFVKYFPNSKVYCFDINISKFIYYSKNIHVFGLNIKDKKKVEKILSKINSESNSNFFDVIIDDGSHYLSDILFSLNTLFRYVKKGGIYVIEDFNHYKYYSYLDDTSSVSLKIEEIFQHLKHKEIFESPILDKDFQHYCFNNILEIATHKGIQNDSYIAFIKKK